jgi:hypothetical protein
LQIQVHFFVADWAREQARNAISKREAAQVQQQRFAVTDTQSTNGIRTNGFHGPQTPQTTGEELRHARCCRQQPPFLQQEVFFVTRHGMEPRAAMPLLFHGYTARQIDFNGFHALFILPAD